MRMIRARAVAWLGIRRMIHWQQAGVLVGCPPEDGNKLFEITNDLIRRSEIVDFVIESYAGEVPERARSTDEHEFLNGMIAWLKENWVEIAKIFLMLFMILDNELEPKPDVSPQPGTEPRPKPQYHPLRSD